MQQRGVELFKGGLFWRGEITAHIHSWRFMFEILHLSSFDFLFVVF